ncbi:unnamed protein product [Orchesella dallaii]|uniref:Uncharacterized protein n=1 Tax=Orchesella dallaii TaxID=48710 RepID=A0ABP1R9L2_9HEXA
MVRVLLVSAVLAAVAVTVSVAISERRERQLRSLFGGGGAGGGAGQPGQPGGLFGGGGGGGGGGGFGGAGGSAGQSGMPGGFFQNDNSDFTVEDLLPIFSQASKKPSPASKANVKVGSKCKGVSGINDFVEDKHKKKEWLSYLLKLVDDGKKDCAEDLSEQLLD